MIEACPKCKSTEFAVARDMKSTRHCKCGATWLPRPKGLTKWDAGNELVKAADSVGECIEELNRDWPELANALRPLRKQISKIFEENGFVEEMKFGI